MSKPTCIKCNDRLNKKNWSPSYKDHHYYVCKLCSNKINKESRLKLKMDVIGAYGNICKCCGEDSIEFLSIDHINNDGAKHRKELKISYKKGDRGIGGTEFYSWLKENNYPKDNFQLLCFNCNVAKHIYGQCPHKSIK